MFEEEEEQQQQQQQQEQLQRRAGPGLGRVAVNTPKIQQ